MTTHHVTSPAPSGPGSLQYAVEIAAAGDDIEVTSGLEIALAEPLLIDRPLSIAGNARLIGTGQDVIRITAHDVFLLGLEIVGGLRASIFFDNASDCTVEDVAVRDAILFGFAGSAPGLTLLRSSARDCGHNGAHFGLSPNMIWDEVEFSGSGDSGVELYRGCDGSMFRRMRCVENGSATSQGPRGYGAMIHSHNVTVQQSIFTGNTRTGVLFYNTLKPTIEGCLSASNGNSGFNFDGSTYVGTGMAAPNLFAFDVAQTGIGMMTDVVLRRCKVDCDQHVTLRHPNGKNGILLFHARNALVEECDIIGKRDGPSTNFNGVTILSPNAGEAQSAQISVQGCRFGISRRNQRLAGDGFAVLVADSANCRFGDKWPNMVASNWSKGAYRFAGRNAASNRWSDDNIIV